MSQASVAGQPQLASANSAGKPHCSTAMAISLVEERKIIIKIEDGRTWEPDFTDHDGKTFICFRKWDSALTRFISGKAIRFTKVKQNVMNQQIIDELIDARNHKSKSEVINELLKTVDAEDKKKTTAVKKRKITAGDSIYVSVVKLDVGGLSFDVMFGIKGSDVWVEGRPDVLRMIIDKLQIPCKSDDECCPDSSAAEAGA